MDITNLQYHSELVVIPVPRNTFTAHLEEGTDRVKLYKDFTVSFHLDGVDHKITVPKNYITDGSTIPRVFWRIYTPFYTEARWASCVHDYIYSDLYRVYTKELADNLLKNMMLHDGASEWTASVFYRAVRLNRNGGGWNK